MVELYFSVFFDCFVILIIWHKLTAVHGKYSAMILPGGVRPVRRFSLIVISKLKRKEGIQALEHQWTPAVNPCQALVFASLLRGDHR
jgi:hypothetical protein